MDKARGETQCLTKTRDITRSESTHFPQESGGEIRINIPVYASKEEVQTAMEAMQVIAERWKEAE